MRLALVLYGGVSLAIYINGVVQELLHLVRATAPDVAASRDSFPASLLVAEPAGTEAVYRKVGQILTAGGRTAPLTEALAESAPIQTRFVVDIISGSSAGGINGIFLAKALANEAPLDGLKNLWIEEGAIQSLLNDKGSYTGLPTEREYPPLSLLNTKRMYYDIEQAIAGMKAGASAADSALVDELDLWITTTDVHGLQLPINLFDNVISERRYKSVLHFSYLSEYAGGGVRSNDFTVDGVDRLLAFSARATASFPFAFKPMQLSDLPGEPGGTAGDVAGLPPAWRGFFGDYLSAGVKPEVIWARPFVDGGYLDNKPFTWATGSLQRRQSDLPVDRRLYYVEPDPGGALAVQRPYGDLPPCDDTVANVPTPDALSSSLLAYTLPRSETIRDDLDALMQRNRVIERTEALLDEIDISTAGALDTWNSLSAGDWAKAGVGALAADRGIQYVAYAKLKLAIVLDDLAEIATLRLGFSPDSDELVAIRRFVQAWYDLKFTDVPAQNQFLLDFDLAFRLRRISFMQRRIDRLLKDPAQATGGDDLLNVRRDLNWILVRLRRADREARAPDPSLTHDVGQLLSREDLLQVLAETRGDADATAAAARALAAKPQLVTTIDTLTQGLAATFKQLFTDQQLDAKALVTGVVAAHPSLGSLQADYERFEAFDSVALPIAYAETGEANAVAVSRISPKDATRIRNEDTGGRKLAGIEVGHFGGFLNEDWRKNDFLWGRLDAAERLIDTLLGPGDVTPELKDELIKEAHIAILLEEPGITTRDDVLRELADLGTDRVDRLLSANETMPLIRRSLAVTGGIMSGIRARADVSGISRVIAPPATKAVRLLEASLEVPWWALVTLVAAPVVLIVAGGLSSSEPVARIGWTLWPWLWLAAGATYFIQGRVRKVKLGTPPPSVKPAPSALSSTLSRLLRSNLVRILAVLVVVFLLLIFPLALLNESIEHVVSWLYGWS